jgi:hypothetical protein
MSITGCNLVLEESSNAAINSFKFTKILKWNTDYIQQLNGTQTRLERVYSIMQDAKLPAAFSDVYSAYLKM